MESKRVFFLIAAVQTLFSCFLFFNSSLLVQIFLVLLSGLCWFAFYTSEKKDKQWKRKLLQEKAGKDLVLNALMEGVVFVDSSFRIEYVNFAANRILGFSKKFLEGKELPVS